MDGGCRLNLLLAFCVSVLMCPAEERCCYVVLADGVEADSHKRPLMHEAQLSRWGRGHCVSLAEPPVVPESGNLIQPENTASTQLRRCWLALQGEEGVVRQMVPSKEDKGQATRQARRPGSGFLAQRGK